MSGLSSMYDLKNEDEAKEYLDNVGIEYRFQCFGEKRPDGCHRLADFLDAFRRDMVKARQVYKDNCDDNKYGFSCFKYGNYNLLGRGGQQSNSDAMEYYKKGCDYKHYPSCNNAALLYQNGLGIEKDFVKAAEYLKLGCDGDDPPSCQTLSTYYLMGKDGVEKDMKKAFDYAEKACHMEHLAGCVNLSVMYRRGDGVEQNLELGEKYKNMAKKLHSQETDIERPIEFGK